MRPREVKRETLALPRGEGEETIGTPGPFSFPGSGRRGRSAIARFSIAFVGVGAVGAAAAESAARAGVGRLTLVDRDVVEESNLARQFLFDAEDAARVAAQGRRPPRKDCSRSSPDVEAARRRRGPRSPTTPARFCPATISSSTARTTSRRGCSSPTRRGRSRLPSIYAACVGEEGLVAVRYLAGRPACAATSRSCRRRDRARPATRPESCRRCRRSWRPLAMTEALRLAVGEAPSRGILSLKVWDGGFLSRRIFESARPSASLPGLRGRPLSGPRRGRRLGDREALRARFRAGRARRHASGPTSRRWRHGSRGSARVRRSPQLLNADLEDVSLTIFSDGRCVVRGTDDPLRARALYDRYVGR